MKSEAVSYRRNCLEEYEGKEGVVQASRDRMKKKKKREKSGYFLRNNDARDGVKSDEDDSKEKQGEDGERK